MFCRLSFSSELLFSPHLLRGHAFWGGFLVVFFVSLAYIRGLHGA